MVEFRLAVDIGGTFTDVVLEGPDGRTTVKVPTTPDGPEIGVMDGIRSVLDTAGRTARDVSILIHGTTLATNALIERKGARTALVTTEGFRDILEMGFEKRAAQYDLMAGRPDPLVPRLLRFTVPERIAADGRVLRPLDAAAVEDVGRKLADAGVEAVAIGLMHAYAHPRHEQAAAEILARQLPNATICLSSAVCPEIREYERFSTVTSNAYIRPLMSGYLHRLRGLLDQADLHCPLYLMMSGGGLTTLEQAARFPVRLVESGPAGGAILAADIAQATGMDTVLSFDMGGTTAKVCLIDGGAPDRSRHFEIARVYRNMKGTGLPVRIPVIEMVEIGAGGGSIVRVDPLGRITVGPESAGSRPGPVCFGRGGDRPTVTDANLGLGKIDVDRFAGGRMALDGSAANRALDRDVGAVLGLSGFWPAAGVVEIVEENMANAARVHAIERGRDISRYSMIAFGGGAPLHAARLAEKLGIDRVVVPRGAGVGSAIGFLRAPVSYQVARSLQVELNQADVRQLDDLVKGMVDEAVTVVAAGAGNETVTKTRQVELRYSGQGHELAVDLPDRSLLADDLPALIEAFERRYELIYGLRMPGVAVEAVSWSVTAMTPGRPSLQPCEAVDLGPPPPAGERPVYDAQSGDLCPHAVYHREDLRPGHRLSGPAVITEDETTTVVPPTFVVHIDGGENIVLTRTGKGDRP